MTTVAIALLALELDGEVDELAAGLADHVVIDDAGCRAVPAGVARAHIAAEHARANELQARRTAHRQRSAAAQQQLIESDRARRAALDYRDRRLLAGDPTLSALEVMIGADVEKAMTARGERDDRLRRGESFGATFGTGGK